MECEMWDYERGYFKVFLSDIGIRNRIVKWEGCFINGHYRFPGGTRAWDIVCPSKLFNKIAEITGLPKKEKKIKRVEHGKNLGKKAVENNHLKINVAGEANLIAPANEKE